jgi:hypothetical protein
LSIQREVGNALRKWALAVIAVGVFQVAAFVWGAATLHTTVAVHDLALSKAAEERKYLHGMVVSHEQRVAALENSMNKLGLSLESITHSINTMSISVAVLRSNTTAR